MHRAVGIEVEAVLGRLPADPLDDVSQLHRAGQAEPDVLRDGERVEQREVLEHHRDAERARVVRAADRGRRAVPEEVAGVRRGRAVDDLHERRLARAVLAEDRVDLSGRDRERDVVVRNDVPVALRDVPELEARCAHLGFLTPVPRRCRIGETKR